VTKNWSVTAVYRLGIKDCRYAKRAARHVSLRRMTSPKPLQTRNSIISFLATTC